MHRPARLAMLGIVILTGSALWASPAVAAGNRPNILLIQAELENTSQQLLGPLYLPSGEHTLKLEIAAIESDVSPSLQIKSLQFDRQ